MEVGVISEIGIWSKDEVNQSERFKFCSYPAGGLHTFSSCACALSSQPDEAGCWLCEFDRLGYYILNCDSVKASV